jgi:hypothetical protein
MFEQFAGISLGLLVLAIIACTMAHSIFPLLTICLVIWVTYHFLVGFTGGGRR